MLPASQDMLLSRYLPLDRWSGFAIPTSPDLPPVGLCKPDLTIEHIVAEAWICDAPNLYFNYARHELISRWVKLISTLSVLG